MRGLPFLLLLFALPGCVGAVPVHPGLTDDTPPVIVIQSPAGGSQIHGATAVSYWASDYGSDVSLVRVTVNGSTIGTQSFNVSDAIGSASFTPTTPGDFIIVVYATSEGGVETESITVHYPGS